MILGQLWRQLLEAEIIMDNTWHKAAMFERNRKLSLLERTLQRPVRDNEQDRVGLRCRLKRLLKIESSAALPRDLLELMARKSIGDRIVEPQSKATSHHTFH